MLTQHDTHDLEHTYPPYGNTEKVYDLRTSPERLRLYCEALERRIEHLEKMMHRYVNLGEDDYK